MEFTIQTDGGSRNNPGDAAIGFVILDEKGTILKEHGEYLGIKTNNAAEYQAAISALKKLKSIIGKEKAKQASVKLLADSELMVRQMNHQYKIQNEKIQPLFLELWNLMLDFGSVSFQAVPREQNKRADFLLNEALDSQTKIKHLL